MTAKKKGSPSAESVRWARVSEMKMLAQQFGMTQEELDTITLDVAGETAGNISTAGAIMVRDWLQIKGADKAKAWAFRLGAA